MNYTRLMKELYIKGGYSINSTLLKEGEKLMNILQDGKAIYIPIVINKVLFESDGRCKTGPFIKDELGKFQPIIGRGLYARIEELFQLDLIEIGGTINIITNLGSNNEIKRGMVCYIIRQKV